MRTQQCNVILIDAGNSAVKFQCHRLAIPSEAAHERSDSLVSQALTTAVTRLENADVSAERLFHEWSAAFHAMNSPDAPSAFSTISTNNITGSDGVIHWHLSWVSVGPVSIQTSIQDAFQRLSGKPAPAAIVSRPEIRLNNPGAQHLKNCYARPSQLGADRWASAVGWMAAYSMGASGLHMIVSAGTATTIDLVRAEGMDGGSAEFLGGWILPGVRLMNESLRAGTRDLHFAVDHAIGMIDIPNQSQKAITGGIGLAQAGFLGSLIDQYSINTIWVHGGFGQWWRAAAESFDRHGSLQQKIAVSPKILFAGLMAIALQDLPAAFRD